MATVLIVDDDPWICQLLCDLAEECGHKVLSAMNGQLALELARAHRPALILSDVMMPVLDGYELAHALSIDPELADTTLFLMSAASNRARQLGAGEVAGFIEKPFDLHQVEQLLHALPV